MFSAFALPNNNLLLCYDIPVDIDCRDEMCIACELENDSSSDNTQTVCINARCASYVPFRISFHSIRKTEALLFVAKQKVT